MSFFQEKLWQWVTCMGVCLHLYICIYVYNLTLSILVIKDFSSKIMGMYEVP